MLVDEGIISLFKQQLEKGGYLDLPAEGNSMYPFIRRGELCRFVPCEAEGLVRGDIVLFYSEQGRLIAHRYVESQWMNGEMLFVMKGDSNLGVDQPIRLDQILGKLSYVLKGNARLSMNDFVVRLWGRMVLAVPIVPGLIRSYLNWKDRHEVAVWSRK